MVKCWGANAYGQLGIGSTADTTKPGADVIAISGATSVVSGSNHTCALLTGGTIRCWGYNGSGQLGVGGTASASTAADAVSGISGATAVALGDNHTCALLSGGTVTCWGYNDQGQLGNGGTSQMAAPGAAVAGISGATSVAAGGRHTCVAVAAGALKCWGQNSEGQLGDRTRTRRLTPVSVPTSN